MGGAPAGSATTGVAGEPPPLDVTVVIAARDAARTLPHQLRALAAQRTRCSWEVLVADNGSTDGTRRVVERARTWLPRVRLLDAGAVRGAGAARNAAAEVARGEVLLFCDADDVVDPGWVEALRTGLRRSDLVAGRLEWRRLNGAAALASRALPQDDGLQVSEPLHDLPCASASNLGIRRARFRRLGGFDPAARYLQDTDLCWRAQLDGARLAFEPTAVVHMRLRAGLLGAWRQGRGTGMGQRWLAARYGQVAAALDGGVGDGDGPVRAGDGPVRAGDGPVRVGDGLVGDGGGPVGDGRLGAGASARTTGLDAGAAGGTAGLDTGARLATARPAGRRGWPARVVHRAVVVGGEVLHVRSRGDVARLSWSTGFGVGFALGGLPDPEPYAPADAALLQA